MTKKNFYQVAAEIDKVLTVKSSRIDFPREGLSEEIWVNESSGYVLRPDVEKKIYQHILNNSSPLDLAYIVESMRVVGSMGTNKYLDDSDLDIHILIDLDKLKEYHGEKTPEEWVKVIFKWYKEDANRLYIGKHPVEVYIQLNPEQDLLSDGCYDIDKSEWLVGPLLVDLDFNPYDVFSGIYSVVQDVVKDTDIKLGQLKRDVIDYKVIREAIDNLPVDYRTKLKDQLEIKLNDIESNILELVKDRKEWLEARRGASLSRNLDEARKDLDFVNNWEQRDAFFKFLNRYEYLRIIKDLEDILEDGIDDSEIDKIKEVL